MPSPFTSVLEKLHRKLPQSTVLLLPSECFFGRNLPLPDGVAAADIRNFAELALEGIAPFPLDQLSWGFLQHKNSRHIYIYAASHGRLRQMGYEQLESYEQVLPGFAATFGVTFKEPVVFASVVEKTLSAVYQQANNPVPFKVISIHIPEDKREGDALKRFAMDWMKTLDTKGYAIDNALWGCGAPVLHNEELKLQIATTSSEAPEGDALIFGATGLALWDADVRDENFAQRQLRQRQLSNRVWGVVHAGVYTVILLLLLQFLIWAGRGWNWIETRKLTSRSAEVSKVERNYDMINRITDITSQQMKPFAMLNETNQDRPATVYFTRVSSNGWNQLKVEGRATAQDEVNHYTDLRRNSPMIKGVDNDQIVTRNGRSEFRLTFTFNELPDLETPAPAEDTAAPAADTAETSTTTPPPTSTP